jgi:hypothetical protein
MRVWLRSLYFLTLADVDARGICRKPRARLMYKIIASLPAAAGEEGERPSTPITIAAFLRVNGQ